MVALLCVLYLTPTSTKAQSLTWLGTLGGNSSSARAVSVDGRVVVGYHQPSSGVFRAFRWENDVMQDLGTFGGSQSNAFDVSGDGSIVVGWAENSAGKDRAFRWESDSLHDLGTLGGSESWAQGVSFDGAVIVGSARTSPNDFKHAFRWSDSSMSDLGTLGGDESEATDVSANGTSISGVSLDSNGYSLGFRFGAGGMENLGTLGGSSSKGLGISGDGSVVVGSSLNANFQIRAFRWTAATDIQDLGASGAGSGSSAVDASLDGSIIVGQEAGNANAFRWTTNGLEDLNTAYSALLTDGSELLGANSLSPDGRYIVGLGRNASAGNRLEAFLLDTQDPNAVDQHGEIHSPATFRLYQNYPNPFNPTTSIQYAIGSRHFVSLKVYDILGKEIATLVNEEKLAGEYKAVWDASTLSSGIYLYQLRVGANFMQTKKMILMR